MKDLDAIKQLADQHKEELGFVLRPALQKAVTDQELFVAETDKEIVGFVHYHHRRDQQTTLYHIAVRATYQRQGIGAALIKTLHAEASRLGKSHILLKCPMELAANRFYSQCGFSLYGTSNGKRRPLNVWMLPVRS